MAVGMIVQVIDMKYNNERGYLQYACQLLLPMAREEIALGFFHFEFLPANDVFCAHPKKTGTTYLLFVSQQ